MRLLKLLLITLLTTLVHTSCVKITEYDYSNISEEVQEASYRKDKILYKNFLKYAIDNLNEYGITLPPEYSGKRYKFGFVSRGSIPFSKHQYPLNVDMDLYFPSLDIASFRICMRQMTVNGAIEIIEVKSNREWDVDEIPLQTFYLYETIPQINKD